MAPAAPRSVQVDDTANTMSALLVPGYGALGDYEFFGIPNQLDPVPATTAGGDVQNGRIYARGITGEHGPGTVGIRVAASGARPAGATAVNDRAFTGPAAEAGTIEIIDVQGDDTLAITAVTPS